MPVQIKRSQAASTLSLTPLIDVMFLLLIFFLVASQFAQEDRSLPIELPTASSAVPMTERPREITVDIDAEGRLAVAGEPFQPEELEQLLRRAVASNPTQQIVIIRADERVAFQSVVTVMDLCNRTGVAKYPVIVREPA